MKPDDAASLSCPDQPCLTLDQYLNYSSSYFTSNSTFVFLNGNHTVQKSFRLRNVSNLTLRGTGSDSKVTITFASRYSTILYKYMSNLRIEWLTFSNHEGKVLTVMEIIRSKGVTISRSTFSGNAGSGIGKNTLYALRITETTITIHRCQLLRNTGIAVYNIFKSHLTLSESTFTRNTETALYIGYKSSALLTGNTSHNTFSDNVAKSNGAAISCTLCSIYIASDDLFENNHVTANTSMGGAIYVRSGNLTISGDLKFSNNTANEGGAVSLDKSTAKITGGDSIMFANNSAMRGGGISVTLSNIVVTTKLKFVGNSAQNFGGALSIGRSQYQIGDNEVFAFFRAAYFSHNRAKFGGAAVVQFQKMLLLRTSRLKTIQAVLCFF